MSNDDLSPDEELASAYLDGDIDEARRAAVSADANVISAVDSFSRVRALLGDVQPVDETTRNAAIQAALDAFDATQAESPGAPLATAPPVISLRRRRERMYRAVTGVAAALVVGFVAISAVNSSHDNNDGSASTATELSASASGPELKAADDAAGGAAAATVAAASEAALGDAASTQIAAASGVPTIDTPSALAEFAASIDSGAAPLAAPEGPTGSELATSAQPPTGGRYEAVPCLSSDQTVLGPIVYQGSPALAVRDTTTRALQAIDSIDCHVLEEVPTDTSP
jgi:hypothetical protein